MTGLFYLFNAISLLKVVDTHKCTDGEKIFVLEIENNTSCEPRQNQDLTIGVIWRRQESTCFSLIRIRS